MKYAFSFTFGCFLSSTVFAANDLDITEIKSVKTNSTTKLQQAIQDVPAAVTIIHREEIAALGITTIPELLRLVPGMRMTQASGWDYRINYHGTNGLIPKRMSLLVNGLPMFRSGVQQIDWMRIPLSIHEIDRIEIVRTPSSASHGSNAFQAVVNIITEHPRDVAKARVVLDGNSDGDASVFAETAFSLMDSTMASVNYSHQYDSGFDEIQLRPDRPFETSQDRFEVDRMNVRTDTTFGDTNINVNLGFAQSDLGIQELDANQTDYPVSEQTDSYLQFNVLQTVNEQHQIKTSFHYSGMKLDQEWPTCYPAAIFMPQLGHLFQLNQTAARTLAAGRMPSTTNPQEIALIREILGLTRSLGAELTQPLCGEGNHNLTEDRGGMDISDTYTGDTWRLVGGLGFIDNHTVAETYFQGAESSRYNYAYVNGDYKPTPHLTINFGGMYESADNIDDNAWSPRVGINTHINDQHTIRLVYSTGVRIPGVIETNRTWNYKMTNWNREMYGMREGWFYFTAYSNPNLNPEQITSTEIGWHSSFKNVEFDIRAFEENLEDLISEKGTFFDFNLTNNGAIDLNGIELETTVNLPYGLFVRAGASYLDTDTDTLYEDSLHADYQGVFSVILKRKLTYAITYIGNSAMNSDSYHTLSVNVSGEMPVITGFKPEWRVGFMYRGFDKVTYLRNIGQPVINQYDDQYHFNAAIGFRY